MATKDQTAPADTTTDASVETPVEAPVEAVNAPVADVPSATADTTPTPVETPVEAPAPQVDSARQARWAAFLDSVEAQRTKDGNLENFLQQKARGEFDVIPDSFV